LEYAREIAKNWNALDANSGYKGYVTTFEVDDEYIKSHTSHTVGNVHHKEYWIPAEELESFNQHIVGEITVVEVY